jgi:hypothetical protein
VTIPETAKVFLVACDAADEVHAYYSESGEVPESWATVVMVWEAAGADVVKPAPVTYVKYIEFVEPAIKEDANIPVVRHEFPED